MKICLYAVMVRMRNLNEKWEWCWQESIPPMNFSNSILKHSFVYTCCSSTICNFHFHLFLGKIVFNSHLEHNLTLSLDELNMFLLN